MFEQALEVAKLYNGVIGGSYAVRGLISDFPCETIDVFVIEHVDHYSQQSTFFCDDVVESATVTYEGNIRIIYLEPCDTDFNLRGLIRYLMSSRELDIEKCYYDQDGVFHATEAACAAAATRVMRPTMPVRLDQIRKYERHGFTIIEPTIHHTCTYVEDLCDEIAKCEVITHVDFLNTHITDEIIDKFSIVDRTYATHNCIVTAKRVDLTVSNLTVFLGTRTSVIPTEIRNSSGHLIFDLDYQGGLYFLDSDDLLIEGRTSSGPIYGISGLYDNPTSSTIPCVIDEGIERLDIRRKFLAGLDVVTDEQVSDISCRYASEFKDGFLIASKNRKFARKLFRSHPFDVDIGEILRDVPSSARIPVEWIHSLTWLVKLTAYGRTKVTMPYYTNYIEWDMIIRDELLAEALACQHLGNDIATFIVACRSDARDMFNSAVFRPYRKVHYSWSTYIVLELAMDEILDMLNNGDDHGEFLREQLLIDHLHDGALKRILDANSIRY